VGSKAGPSLYKDNLQISLYNWPAENFSSLIIK